MARMGLYGASWFALGDLDGISSVGIRADGPRHKGRTARPQMLQAHKESWGSFWLRRRKLWVGASIVAADIVSVVARKSLNPTASAGLATSLILWVSAIYALVRSSHAASGKLSSPRVL